MQCNIESTDHEVFISALRARRRIRLTFIAKDDGTARTRTCAPFDFGPPRRIRDGRDRYHAWDYEGDPGPHPVMLLPEQIVRIEALDDLFDPAEFVTWNLVQSPWIYARDWGGHS